MISGLKPYPAYKPSGVEWLGEVPKRWEVRRLRTAVAMRVSNVDKHVREGETPVRLCNYVDVYKHDWISQRIDFMRATATPEEVSQFRLAEGDVLITKDSEAWDDIGVPAVVTEPADDVISGYHLALLRPIADVLTGGYLLRALQSKGLAHQFHVAAKGVTRYGLSHDGIKSVWLALPPLAEQAAIARYLDDADRRIRRCIQAKEKLVELLEEQRQALVNEAVTGRVDVRTGRPYPAYKLSGVEWLGNVPAHWDVRPAKWHFRETDERTQTGSEELLSVSHISGVTPRSKKNVTMFMAESNVGHKLCMPGDLVINTMWAWMGALGVSDQIGIVSPSYAVYRPRRTSRLLDRYVESLLRTELYKTEFICRSTGIRSSRLRMYPEEFLRIRLPCPPNSEQHCIARYLDRTDRNIRRCIRYAQREIELLNEYRTRLISDVVTGKLDVRQVVAALPEVDRLSADNADDVPDHHGVAHPGGPDASPQAAEART